jgi:ATP-binding cassette subfamily B protein
VADPRILVLDDATSAVDPSKEQEIRGALTSVMKDRTTIVIAHRPTTIRLADRVVFLGDDGSIVTGHHDEMMRTNSDYRKVLATYEDSSHIASSGHKNDHEEVGQ